MCEAGHWSNVAIALDSSEEIGNMKLVTKSVPVFCLYPVGIFFGICLIPWWKNWYNDDVLPLGTAYVSGFGDWPVILLWHLAATIGLSLVAVGLHLWIARLMKTTPEAGKG